MSIKSNIIFFFKKLSITLSGILIFGVFAYVLSKIIILNEVLPITYKNTESMFKKYVTGNWISPTLIEIVISFTNDEKYYIIVNNKKYELIVDNINVMLGVIKTHSTEGYAFQFNKIFDVSGYMMAVTFDSKVLPCVKVRELKETCTGIFYWKP